MLVLTVLLGSVLLFIVYQLATTRIEPGTDELKAQASFLAHELAGLSDRYQRNQARLTVLERETQIYREANRLLRDEESRRQADTGRLRTELDFYRRLSGTSGTQTGLAIYAVEIIATDSDRVVQFVLTLTQNIRRASVISGKVRVALEGTLDDRPHKLNWTQLSDNSESGPTFRFKYFQQLDGYLTMPENFHPIRLRITLEVKDQRKPVSHAFDWRTLLNGADHQAATENTP